MQALLSLVILVVKNYLRSDYIKTIELICEKSIVNIIINIPYK